MSRVLVVTNDFPTRRGGIESFVLALCQGMPPEEVVVYTAAMPGAEAYDAGLAFPVYRDPASTLLPTRPVARRVVEVMRRHGCDRVVFGASSPLGLLAPALRRAGARRIVALTHGHEVWWATVPLARPLLRRVGDSVDVLTYVSEWCRDRIAPALSPGAAARMVRLSPGVDPDRFHAGCGGAEVRRRLGLGDAPVVVCTGRLVRRKGQDTLLRAWPAVLDRHPTARLLLVGDGPDRERLERLTGSLGLRDAVVLTGGVAWGDVPAYTDAGDVFAMPCRTRLLGLEPEAWGDRVPGGAGVRAAGGGGGLRGAHRRPCSGAARWCTASRRWPPHSSGCCPRRGSGCAPTACPTGRVPHVSWGTCWPSDMPKAATLGGGWRPADYEIRRS
ncbi:glycosyltransferase family 4 protein [Nocardioides panacis]|uniref:glycosyltransferase family 4 protein n=1 Tax=Nocardioides panacis TaxID=2849501 RepID=UPI0020B1E25D|nr:glycosyltransferase family 4 protein [Nocardioides panacis]